MPPCSAPVASGYGAAAAMPRLARVGRARLSARWQSGVAQWLPTATAQSHCGPGCPDRRPRHRWLKSTQATKPKAGALRHMACLLGGLNELGRSRWFWEGPGSGTSCPTSNLVGQLHYKGSPCLAQRSFRPDELQRGGQTSCLNNM